MTTEPKSAAAVSTKKKDSTWDLIKTFLVAVVLALIFRSVAYEQFHIPSSSMVPTLLEGDYIFVSKPSYGYSRYSFPLGLELFKGRLMHTEPQRGDVAVFRLPKNPKVDYIKRIIGLPGDQIQVVDGVLQINGQPLQRRPGRRRSACRSSDR